MTKQHFQIFTSISSPDFGTRRAKALRQKLVELGLHGFLVPRSDEHQNEYVAPSSERLAWLTGFAGSAGMAIVLLEKAAIFVDGRYTIQVREQVDCGVFEPQHLIDAPPEEWLQANLPKGARLGYDPWLHTARQLERLETAVAKAGAELVVCTPNLVDTVWSDRLNPPLGPIVAYSVKYAGEEASSKIQRVQAALSSTRQLACGALVVSDPHSLAWMLNIRGSDTAHTPIALGFAIVPREGQACLYVDGRKIGAATRAKLAQLVRLAEPDALIRDLAGFGARGARVLFDGTTAPAILSATVKAAGGVPEIGNDPLALMKAAKNGTEISGTKAAHIRDGIALTRFLAWFDKAAPRGKLTEIEAVNSLEAFRKATGKLKDISFPSIAGAGPNAAIPHYHVTQASDRLVERGIFLIDSGGQYIDGTTDITRTISVGPPTPDMRRCFTLVLKGHIALARAVFPKGTSGAQLDAFARSALWQAGLDFDHGTGHGVGCYLSVHEGPQRISKMGHVPLEAGMIVSNEPGYYRPGHWGIRIENLLVVEPRIIRGAEREMLGFDTISLAPIDLRLVDAKLLDATEKDWLNAYHARVRRVLAPKVGPEPARWLERATRAI